MFNQKAICLVSVAYSQTQSKPDHTSHVGHAGTLIILHTQLALVMIFTVADSRTLSLSLWVIRILFYCCRRSEFMQYRCWGITHTIMFMIYSLFNVYSLVFLLQPSTHTLVRAHTCCLTPASHTPPCRLNISRSVSLKLQHMILISGPSNPIWKKCISL